MFGHLIFDQSCIVVDFRLFFLINLRPEERGQRSKSLSKQVCIKMFNMLWRLRAFKSYNSFLLWLGFGLRHLQKTFITLNFALPLNFGFELHHFQLLLFFLSVSPHIVGYKLLLFFPSHRPWLHGYQLPRCSFPPMFTQTVPNRLA